ncbi:CPBP family intramembrane metalloprotease [Paenibacillus sp. MY03]|jgi:membrane protease YdiL (CAAX protease family)|uniref:CPBP family intramembrane metalloprotease n=1 Tax=Paenibacillus agaridevorans TaxID=171404 RepID=A0A2R5F0Z5_9BACL|nr:MULTISPECIES: type II CAAX endopeptidase family protein [Paenibacillus]OUS77403.1 CPBP family intramembrane metalloprotease [Paenibacillus sp. MY03]GBG12065.1 CPBP family intramembrane metalloprotease [Paenibacillus agaridevorans]
MKKKFDIRKIKIRKVKVDEIDDRMLLINLYATQVLTLIIGIIWLLFQHQNLLAVMAPPRSLDAVWWGLGLAAAVVAIDLLISRWVPEDASDDGGVNDRIFRSRAVWHIAVISLVVAICEELLFRGAIQHAIGPYWTSIVFAAIHVRYLRHWIPTGLVFSISYGLGFIYEESGTLWAPIIAHFAIDFIMGLIIRFRRES